jgi:formylglycine-generating enzyme required for sulfatase activity
MNLHRRLTQWIIACSLTLVACEGSPDPMAWCEVLVAEPDPAVVTDAGARSRMIATKLPWKVRDRKTGIIMLLVPPGDFEMGSPPDEPRRSVNEHQHHASILQAFYLGQTEVTQDEWKRVRSGNPAQFLGAESPVEQVSWNDCQSFCVAAGLRMPSEVEWEYAARGGSPTIYPFGDSDTELYVYAWFNAIAPKTNPVGLKRPNQFGLFDMLGNVLEVTQDCWHDDYIGAPKDGIAWEANCNQIPSSRPVVIRLNRTNYVARGGSLKDDSTSMRSASRFGLGANERRPNIGFRLARDF